MTNKPERRPGDLLLDRYFPHADKETRERAREAFRKYALLLYKIGKKLDAEERRDSTEESASAII